MRLVHHEKQRFWEGRIEGTVLTTRSGKIGGKPREKSKDHSSPWKVGNEFQKAGMAQLRKGFVLEPQPEDPSSGPRFLRFFGGSYTGAHGLAVTHEEAYLTRNTGDRSCEFLVLDPTSGDLLACHRLEVFDVWKILPVPGTREVLLLVDHGVQRLDLETGNLEPLTQPAARPVGLLEFAAGSLLTVEGEQVVVRDLSNHAIRFSRPLFPEAGTHHRATVSAALRGDGEVLALQDRPGCISLFRVSSGDPIQELSGDFQGLTSLSFHPGGAFLAATEAYGNWRFSLFDLETGDEIGERFARPHPTLGEDIPAERKFFQVAFHPAGSHVLLRHEGELVQASLGDGSETAILRPEFVVKTSGTGGFAFACAPCGSSVLVRTDSGVVAAHSLVS